MLICNPNQSRISFGLLFLLAAAAVIFCSVLIRRPARTTHQLPDGTVLHLDRAVKGRQGTFVLGNPVQKILWRLSDNAKYQRGLLWLRIRPPETNTSSSAIGEGMLWFWFSIQQTQQNGRELQDYLRTNLQIAIVNRHGESYTNKFYPGVTPDAAILFFRVPGPPTNEPSAIRFLTKERNELEDRLRGPDRVFVRLFKLSGQMKPASISMYSPRAPGRGKQIEH